MPKIKNYKVLWAKEAQKDLSSIMDFIAEDKPDTALKLFRTIQDKAKSLKQFPERGRHPPEIAHLQGLPFHEMVLSPWRLVYRIQGDMVEVLAFFDGRRDLEDILYERLSRVIICD